MQTTIVSWRGTERKINVKIYKTHPETANITTIRNGCYTQPSTVAILGQYLFKELWLSTVFVYLFIKLCKISIYNSLYTRAYSN